MTDRSVMDRAMTLAEMAPHTSVTVGALAGLEGTFPDSRLHEPPLTYLEDTEAPAYVLTNAKRGIGLGTKRNTTKPAGDRGTIVLVTGRRTLCLVGREDEDEQVEVPHDAVADVSCHTGWLASRFVLRTPRKQYHCWVGRDTEAATLDQAAEYVRERTSDSPSEITVDDGASQLTYRGQPITPENHPAYQTGSTGNGSRTEADRSDGVEGFAER